VAGFALGGAVARVRFGWAARVVPPELVARFGRMARVGVGWV